MILNVTRYNTHLTSILLSLFNYDYSQATPFLLPRLLMILLMISLMISLMNLIVDVSALLLHQHADTLKVPKLPPLSQPRNMGNAN